MDLAPFFVFLIEECEREGVAVGEAGANASVFGRRQYAESIYFRLKLVGRCVVFIVVAGEGLLRLLAVFGIFLDTLVFASGVARQGGPFFLVIAIGAAVRAHGD